MSTSSKQGDETASTGLSIQAPLETSSTYQKAKRYLIFGAGALLLLSTVGVFEADTTWNGLKVAHPELVGWVLTFGIAYYFLQLNLFWATQISTVRTSAQLRFDHFISNFVAVSAVAFYAHNAPSEAQLGYPINFIIYALLVVALFAASPFFAWVLQKASAKQKEREDLLVKELLANNWTLIFSPLQYTRSDRKLGKKEITFRDDGTIGEGRNQNESKWSVKNGILEIFDNESRIFSRFRLVSEGVLLNTNDTDLRSIRNQVLHRSEISMNLSHFEP